MNSLFSMEVFVVLLSILVRSFCYLFCFKFSFGVLVDWAKRMLVLYSGDIEVN